MSQPWYTTGKAEDCFEVNVFYAEPAIVTARMKQSFATV